MACHISIVVEQTGPMLMNAGVETFRATVKTDAAETVMPTCYSKEGSITEALAYINERWVRRYSDNSKFALFPEYSGAKK